MSKTVVGVFSDYTRAEEVAHELESQGFSRSDISVVANDHKGDYQNLATGDGTHAASGAGTGAAIGGVAGLALGLVALAIPGIGPIIALGPLAAALTGAGIGAAAGGLIGAMTSMGVPEEDAHQYSGMVKEGQALVMVSTQDDRADAAASLLERYGANDVDERDGGSMDRTQTASPVRAATDIPSAAATTTRTTAAEIQPGSSLPVVEENLEVGKRAVERGGVRVYSHMTEVPVSEQVNLQNYGTKGEAFDTYAPGYQYGSQLAGDSRYAGREWTDVEASARSDWERRGEGTWESMKDSIRHGWDKVRGAA